jgi:hypothetical protein
MNKATAWTSLWGMVITYLPGTLINVTLLVTRKPQLRLWNWFKVSQLYPRAVAVFVLKSSMSCLWEL